MRAEPGRVRSQRGRGGKGREERPAGAAPRPAAAALRCPGNSVPTAPSRPGEAEGRLRSGRCRDKPGGASAPSRSAAPASPGRRRQRGAKARGTRTKAGITFLVFLFIWFGFPTLDDAATATQCLTHLPLNLEVYFSNSVNRRF